jgi:hypothetical protein
MLLTIQIEAEQRLRTEMEQVVARVREEMQTVQDMKVAPGAYVERMQWQHRRNNKVDKMELRAVELER